MSQCKDVPTRVKSVIFMIRLAGDVTNEVAAEILAKDKVKKAIDEAFRAEAARIVGAQLSGEPLDGATASKILSPIKKTVDKEREKALKAKGDYKKLERDIKQLKCTWEASPVGAFINEKKTMLIVVGAIAAVGSAAVMYQTKSGDLPAKGLSALTELAASKFELGNATVGVKGVTFVPSKREVGGTLGTELKGAKGIKTSFAIRAVVSGKTLKELKLSESFVVPVSPTTRLVGSGAVGQKDGKDIMELGVGVKYSRGGLDVSVTAFSNKGGGSHAVGTKASVGVISDTERLFGKGSYVTAGVKGKAQMSNAGGAGYEPGGSIGVGATLHF